MFRRTVFAIPFLCAAASAQAGGGANYSATDADGTVERVVETRALADERLGVIVSYTRTDGSRSFVEYAFACKPMAYAYLGMIEDVKTPSPNLLPLRVESDEILGNEARPVPFVPVDDEINVAMRPLATSVCS